MGPRLFRRGNAGTDPGTVTKGTFYTALQWGHVFSDVEITFLSSGLKTAAMLQWGHVFSDVEIRNLRPGGVADVGLQWGHVFSDVEI